MFFRTNYYIKRDIKISSLKNITQENLQNIDLKEMLIFFFALEILCSISFQLIFCLRNPVQPYSRARA